jgi:hypothetical protein
MFFPAADTIAFAEGGVEVLRINSSSQVEFQAGTSSLPTVAASGDLNTGMFFPAADTIAFTNGGTEEFRIGPAGQFGIAGANYGTAGQVMTSAGAAASPSWSAVPAPAALSTASGSAPSYSARAWVNFNGTGTVAIRASGNVTSITDSGVGTYDLNFTTAMPNANYAIMGGATFPGNSARTAICGPCEGATRTTSVARVLTANTGTQATLDSADAMVAVFV